MSSFAGKGGKSQGSLSSKNSKGKGSTIALQSKKGPALPASNDADSNKSRKNAGKTKGSKGDSAPSGPSAKEVKKRRKAEREALEAARKGEVENMMKIYESDESDQSDGSVVDDGDTDMHYDRFGNIVQKADLRDAELEEKRAAARAARAAKEEAAARAAASASSSEKIHIKNPTGATDYASKADKDMAAAKAKAEAGERLSNKEKRLLKKHEERVAAKAAEDVRSNAGLTAFSLTLPSKDGGGDGTMTAAEDGSTDVIIEEFSISAPKRELFRDANLRLAAGRRYGLLGPNGRGKSTLLRFLAARELPVPAAIDVLLVEQEAEATERSVVEQVLMANETRQTLLQEEKELLDDMDAAESRDTGDGEVDDGWSDDQWAEKSKRLAQIGGELHAIGADAAEGKVRKILTGLGFTDDMQDGPTTILSGGWRMRVSLARALFMEPRLLMLDEPTNHLDLHAVLWLDDYLANRWKTTLLVVSHDQDFLDSICTDIVHLQDLKLAYYGHGVDRFREMLGQVNSKTDKDYRLQEKELSALKKKGFSSAKAEEALLKKTGRSGLLERRKDYTVKFTLTSPDDRVPSISVLDVSFGYREDREPLLKDLRFKVDTDTRVAIVGPNGVGKSTLLNLLSGKLNATSGEVSRHRHLRIGRYDQHFHELLPQGKSPSDYLRSEYNISEQDARKRLGQFGLDGARHLIPIAELSGGQKARVIFASLSLQQAHILLLDEPTNHLDMESVDALIQGIREYKGGVVIVSHDARLIAAMECQLWVCEGRGKVKVHQQGFEHYRRSLLREIAAAEARVEAASAAKAARRAQERADRVGKHSRRSAHAQIAKLTIGKGVGQEGSRQDRNDARNCASAEDSRKEAMASVFGKKKKKQKG